MHTDASTKGLGFVLSQVQNGNERVVAYGGRSLSTAERNYAITELEALAIVEGINKFSSYLIGPRKFTVVTDHQALKWLFKDKHSSGRLARWSLYLQSFNFDVEYRPANKQMLMHSVDPKNPTFMLKIMYLLICSRQINSHVQILT